MSLIGAIFAGGIGCGIYATNSAEACAHILVDSRTRIVVVENKHQLDKVIECVQSGAVTGLLKIVQYTGRVQDDHDGLVIDVDIKYVLFFFGVILFLMMKAIHVCKQWETLMSLSSRVEDQRLQQRIRSMAPNKCASLIYTVCDICISSSNS